VGDIRVEILQHGEYRAAACCLCGAEWDENLLAVALFTGGQLLGDLCPRCLSRTPGEAASAPTGRLLQVAKGLKGMGRWPTSLREVIRAERDALKRRLHLSDSDLQRVVDDRYREFLDAE
jgi:hypothetical protein